MQAFTQQQVLDAYERLPEPIKEAIFEEATTEKIQMIGKKHGLLLDKLGALAEDVGYVMLGLIPAKEFPAYIMDACGVSAEKAGAIITDLNQEIFSQVQEHIFSATKDSKPAPVKPVPTDEVSPAFRPSSFAMPMQGGGEKSSKGQPTVAPMIFPQKMRMEETRQPANLPQNQPSIIPKAPDFRETTQIKQQPIKGSTQEHDAYREAIL